MAAILIFITFFTRQVDQIELPHFITWNVGQGLWTTYISEQQCHHFDAGGQFFPQKNIWRLCQKRSNTIFISHYDWDHYSFLKELKFRMQRVCLERTRFSTDSPCTRGKNFVSWTRFEPCQYLKNRNDNSNIVVLNQSILLPGDSTKKSEAKWQKFLNKKIRLLLVGHHGSNTSSGKALLQALPALQHAVVSAKKSKYGHPHQKVRRRFHEKNLGLILTEDWGSIAWQQSHWQKKTTGETPVVRCF